MSVRIFFLSHHPQIYLLQWNKTLLSTDNDGNDDDNKINAIWRIRNYNYTFIYKKKRKLRFDSNYRYVSIFSLLVLNWLEFSPAPDLINYASLNSKRLRIKRQIFFCIYFKWIFHIIIFNLKNNFET